MPTVQLTALALLLLLDSVIALNCPSGWKGWSFLKDDTCYKTFCSRKNFRDAQAACELQGGMLMKADADEINVRVRAELVWGTPSYWIGASERGQAEGAWTWTDRTKLDETVVLANNASATNFANWAPGQPDNARGRDEECVMVGYSPSSSQTNVERGLVDNQWYDVPCCMELPYVCEIKDSVTPPDTSGGGSKKCNYMFSSFYTCPYDYQKDENASIALILWVTILGMLGVAAGLATCWMCRRDGGGDDDGVEMEARGRPNVSVNNMMSN